MTTAWVLEPAPDLVEARAIYIRSLVAALLRVGQVWLGDDGSIAGGRRLARTIGERLRAAPLPQAAGVSIGPSRPYHRQFPPECRRRYDDDLDGHVLQRIGMPGTAPG